MEFTLTGLTEQDVNIIGAGLQELPFKVAAPLIQKLQQQVTEQSQPAKEGEVIEASDNP